MGQHIKIPGELAQELDRIAGHKRKAAFVIDILWNEVRRGKQQHALRVSAGTWKDHPELADGARPAWN